jgi:cysteine protease ATG4
MNLNQNNENNYIYFRNYISSIIMNFDIYIKPNTCTKLTLLGREYEISNKQGQLNFLSDFRSHILITYRSNFRELLPLSNITTDSGWGCMIRSGQMILAETLLRSECGRDWRLDKIIETNNIKNILYSIAHKDILLKFIDNPSIECIFSIHRIIQLGLYYNKKPQDWYGPDTISLILRDLVNLNKNLKIKIYLGLHSIVVINDIIKLCCELEDNNIKKNINDLKWKKKLLLIIPIRVGINNINPIYIDTLLNLLSLKQSVGFIGGKPGKSFYFIGYRGTNLIYLDPHNIQNKITIDDCFPKVKDLLSYHCLKPNEININKIDPSLSIGFFINDKKEFDSFYKSIKEINEKNALFFEIINNKKTIKLFNEDINANKNNTNDNNFDDTWELI